MYCNHGERQLTDVVAETTFVFARAKIHFFDFLLTPLWWGGTEADSNMTAKKAATNIPATTGKGAMVLPLTVTIMRSLNLKAKGSNLTQLPQSR
jgi:hypothetical protein